MPAPVNSFKRGLKEGRLQIGLWQALGSPNTVEICAGAGYDWLLLDAEHGPSDVPRLAEQLRAMRGSPSHAIIRPPIGETWVIKQMLDIGAQTILVPMVHDAALASEMVKAVRYPPQGVRGVGAALARASDFNRIGDYLQTANDEICLLVQVESRVAIDNLDAICAVDGVDGVFIGPSDLAADMGYLGRPGAPEVQEVVERSIARILASGKAAGILIGDLGLAKRYAELGATFVGIGNDVGLLSNAAARLLKDFNGTKPIGQTGEPRVY
jgi:4-hydroxy-2-oxoheptanedioate aldolase